MGAWASRLCDRKFLARIAIAAPFALAALYWMWVVGLSDPATRLSGELEGRARRALIGRTPVTFVHRPVNQWTLPVKEFDLTLQRDGTLMIRYGREGRREYRTQLAEPVRVAGRFELSDVGSGVEIELIPGGDSADIASVRPVP